MADEWPAVPDAIDTTQPPLYGWPSLTEGMLLEYARAGWPEAIAEHRRRLFA